MILILTLTSKRKGTENIEFDDLASAIDAYMNALTQGYEQVVLTWTK